MSTGLLIWDGDPKVGIVPVPMTSEPGVCMDEPPATPPGVPRADVLGLLEFAPGEENSMVPGGMSIRRRVTLILFDLAFVDGTTLVTTPGYPTVLTIVDKFDAFSPMSTDG